MLAVQAPTGTSLSEIDERVRQKLLTEATKARQHAELHRRAVTAANNMVVGATLQSRILELESLAQTLEAQAAKLSRVLSTLIAASTTLSASAEWTRLLS